MYRRSLDRPRCASPDLGRTRQVRPRSQSALKRLVSLVFVGPVFIAFFATFILTLHHSYAQGLIATSVSHTCALTRSSDAGVRCWGNNLQGQLGDGTITQRNEPVAVVGLSSGVSAIGVGNNFSCALLTTGGVKCWGDNMRGQLGGWHESGSAVPVSVLSSSGGDPISGVTALSVGAGHACVLLNTGGAKCWGLNDDGQLGDGSITSRAFPVQIPGATFSGNLQAIDAGETHTCIGLPGYHNPPNSSVYCVGNNTYGKLGDGTQNNSLTPQPVSDFADNSKLSAGGYHSCAIRTGGILFCWGYNMQGQLGDGTTSSYTTPVQITDPVTSFVTRISAGFLHTCASIIMNPASDPEVYCWGRNVEGQIGDGTWTDRYNPTALSPQVTAPLDISAKGYHSCAWMAECSVTCWGRNHYGQIGDGTTTNAPSPVNISICQPPTATPTATPTPTNTPPPESSPVVSPTATPAPGESTRIPVAPNTGNLPPPTAIGAGTTLTITAPILTLSPTAPKNLSLAGYRFTITQTSTAASVSTFSFEDSPFEALSRASNKRRQIITKRNQITLRKLGKGTYRVTYQAVFKQKLGKGSKTIFGKMSAARVFTVR